jgi:ribosomal protein S27AE
MIQSAALRRFYAFLVEHETCPDPHVVTKETSYTDDDESIRLVEAICPGCGGSVVLTTSKTEAELIDSVGGSLGQSTYLH